MAPSGVSVTIGLVGQRDWVSGRWSGFAGCLIATHPFVLYYLLSENFQLASEIYLGPVYLLTRTVPYVVLK